MLKHVLFGMIAAAAVSSPAFADVPPPTSPPAELAQYDFFVGTWHCSGKAFATPMGPEHGVHFVEAPRYETYGTVVVFEDLYGNRWDLIERKGAA